MHAGQDVHVHTCRYMYAYICTWHTMRIFSIDQPGLKVVGLLCIVNGVDKQVNKPSEGVLVHGLNVGQVSDGEE